MNGQNKPLVIGTILALIGVVTFALSFRSGLLKDSADWQAATAFSLAEGASLKGRVDRAERDIERIWQTVSQQRKEIADKLERIMERLPLPAPYPPGGGPR